MQSCLFFVHTGELLVIVQINLVTVGCLYFASEVVVGNCL